MASVSKHIRQLRVARGMTQEELARKLYVTRQTVSAWETGRSQPDLDTLEQIAAALGVEVTEVIYGAPPASPAPGPLKRRWALIGGAAVLALALVHAGLVQTGIWGTWRGGFQYQLGEPAYQVTYAPLEETCSLEIDLTAPESNVGKVLYADDAGCRIEVSQIDTNGTDGEQHRVFFRAHGTYDHRGGQLVSGAMSVQTGSAAWTLEDCAAASGTVGGLTGTCGYAGMSGMNWKDGNEFGFYITADRGDHLSTEQVLNRGGIMTVTVSGLTRMTTHRMWRWDRY